MVVVLRQNIKEQDKNRIRSFLETKGFKVREIVGEEETIFGAVGLIPIDLREVELLPGVERVIPITKPYKLASREFKKADTIVEVGPVKIGGLRLTAIAGPCAVESREQILEAARLVRESGAVILRGGAYKPRTSPYAFQGLGEKGLQYLKEAGERESMPVVSEIVSPELTEMMQDYVDLFQVGARNMQNYELLKRIGEAGKPVILKRGPAARVEDWLMAAEYLLAHGTEDVVLCERGIRTFETYTRNTLDISAIPVVKKLSHLPVIVDPSHATGLREKVPPMALAAIAAGADGVIVEVHPDPENAASDGAQSLFPDQFEKLMRDIEALSPVVGKEIQHLLPKPSVDVPAAPVRAIGSTTRVAFQGEHGAFGEIAAIRYFEHTEIETVAMRSFPDVFSSVLSGECDYGMVPIENSLAGSIHENYDHLLQFPDVQIIGEKKIRIVHNLIGVPEADIGDIRRVYSQIPALAQCTEFLDKYPGIERVPYYDTAGSVAFVASEKRREIAAIASLEAAKVYGMKVIQEGIETNSRNYTRFFIIAKNGHAAVAEPTIASLVFSTPDQPGALFECMKTLADRNINLKKLESRPILGKPWQYMFYLDVELPDRNEAFEEAVTVLSEQSEDLRILGMYRS